MNMMPEHKMHNNDSHTVYNGCNSDQHQLLLFIHSPVYIFLIVFITIFDCIRANAYNMHITAHPKLWKITTGWEMMFILHSSFTIIAKHGKASSIQLIGPNTVKYGNLVFTLLPFAHYSIYIQYYVTILKASHFASHMTTLGSTIYSAYTDYAFHSHIQYAHTTQSRSKIKRMVYAIIS